ncbi:MAG: FxsA family protein [Pseudomonadota bacterium]
MPFIILFIIIPLVEIYFFLLVGDAVGILQTLLLCVLTAIIGGFLVKKQGLETLFNAQKNLQGGTLPMKEIFDGFCLVVAGALLMTPGFFTDIVGFSLLVPFFRDFLKKMMLESGKFKVYGAKSGTYTHDETVIDGDYETVNPETKEIER